MNANGKIILKDFNWRLHRVLIRFNSPRAVAEYLGLFVYRNRKILMPGNKPIRSAGLIEIN